MPDRPISTAPTNSSGFITGVEFLEINKKKRFCKFRGCKKRLSRYNPNSYCFLHVIIGLEEEDKEYRKEQYRLYKIRMDMVLKSKGRPLT